MTKKEFLQDVGKYRFSVRVRRLVEKYKFTEQELDHLSKNLKLRKISQPKRNKYAIRKM